RNHRDFPLKTGSIPPYPSRPLPLLRLPDNGRALKQSWLLKLMRHLYSCDLDHHQKECLREGWLPLHPIPSTKNRPPLLENSAVHILEDRRYPKEQSLRVRRQKRTSESYNLAHE